MSDNYDSQEPQLASIRIPLDGSDKLGDLSVKIVPVSEAWKIGLSAADVRWLLGIPEPPRKPMTYEQLLRRRQRQGCEFVAGVADGWEVCRTHGTARKKTTR